LSSLVSVEKDTEQGKEVSIAPVGAALRKAPPPAPRALEQV